jgi:hypothetical protein
MLYRQPVGIYVKIYFSSKVVEKRLRLSVQP